MNFMMQQFQKYKYGKNILKYNFGNDQISWRFVRLGNEGIAWGTEQDNCRLKGKSVLTQHPGSRSPTFTTAKSQKTSSKRVNISTET